MNKSCGMSRKARRSALAKTDETVTGLTKRVSDASAPYVAAGAAAAGAALAKASSTASSAAEQLAPRVEQVREAVAPQVEHAREVVAPHLAAARDAAAEAARERVVPRYDAARETLAPHLASARASARDVATDAARSLGSGSVTDRVSDVVSPVVDSARGAVDVRLPKISAAFATALAAGSAAKKEALSRGGDAALVLRGEATAKRTSRGRGILGNILAAVGLLALAGAIAAYVNKRAGNQPDPWAAPLAEGATSPGRSNGKVDPWAPPSPVGGVVAGAAAGGTAVSESAEAGVDVTPAGVLEAEPLVEQAGADGGADSGADGGADGGADSGADGGADGGADSGADGGADSDADSGADGGADAGADGGADSGADSGADGGADSGADGGADAGADGGADSGADAEAEARATAEGFHPREDSADVNGGEPKA